MNCSIATTCADQATLRPIVLRYGVERRAAYTLSETRGRLTKLRALALALFVAIACFHVAIAKAETLSQASSNSSTELRRQQQREQAQRQQLEKHPEVLQPQVLPGAEIRLPAREKPCFTIRQVRLLDDKAFPWLYGSLAGRNHDDSPIGKCLGIKGIRLLENRAQNALIGAGYITSRVMVGPQNLSTGVLRLTVIPGRIWRVKMNSRNGRGHWSTALPSRPGDLLNVHDLDQALENFRRSPTSTADIKIAPAPRGSPPGYSNVLIDYEQGFPFRLTLTADDGGGPATGRYQGGITLSYDNPLTLNDLFYVSYNRNLPFLDPGDHGNKGDTVYYSIPFGYWALTLDYSHYSYYQSVAGYTQDYIYSGTSHTYNVKLTRVVYRDADSKYTVGIKAFARGSRNYIDHTEITVQRRNAGGWEASFAGKRYIGHALLQGNAIYRYGTGAFGARTAPEQAFGDGTTRMRLLDVDATLTAPFALRGQHLRYTAEWRGQTNYTPLVPQDRFAIGGRYTVRGFDGDSQLAASRGWLLRNTVGLLLPRAGAEIYYGLDHGEVSGQGSQDLVGQSLTGQVLGLQGQLGRLQYDLFAGWPVDKPSRFVTSKYVLGFNLSLTI